MKAIFLSRESFVWFVLVALTLASWLLGTHGGVLLAYLGVEGADLGAEGSEGLVVDAQGAVFHAEGSILHAEGFVLHAEGSIMLLLALIKVSMVISNFMEVRHAPLALKLCCRAWLFIVALSVIGIYNNWIAFS